MVATDQAVEGRSAFPNRTRRKTPEEIEGFQSVVLSPGGQVDLLNISNSGMLVETGTRAKPGSAVQVRIAMTAASHVIKARIVRSEVTTVGGTGLRYQLAIAFDEIQDLIDWDDAAAVDTPAPGGPERPMDRPRDEAHIGLHYASSPNRW